MNLKSDIDRYKKQLIARAAKKGLYENFGEKEISKLKSKYFDELYLGDYFKKMEHQRLFKEFFDWCATYTGR